MWNVNISELIVMARYFPLLETRNRFANDGLWRGRARGAACGRDVVADMITSCERGKVIEN